MRKNNRKLSKSKKVSKRVQKQKNSTKTSQSKFLLVNWFQKGPSPRVRRREHARRIYPKSRAQEFQSRSIETQRHAPPKDLPPTVSQREFDLHQISHLPFRSWCDHCVGSTAREDLHPLRHEPSNDPRVGMDHFLLRRSTARVTHVQKPCSM